MAASRTLLVTVAFRNRLAVAEALVAAGFRVGQTTTDSQSVDSTIEVKTTKGTMDVADAVWATTGLGSIYCNVRVAPPALIPDRLLGATIRRLYTPDELTETLGAGVSMATVRAWARRNRRVPS